ncbi:MAG: DUF1579 domain-containing protein [Pirellulaceae bacterium]
MKRALSLALFLLVPAMASAQEYPQPGPEHEMLKATAGEWTCLCKTSDGTESKGVSTSKMECGGLWLVTNFEGDFGGAKFQGKGLDSYDPKTKKFVAVWVDSMSTTPMTLEGTYDEKTKTLTMTGEGKMPDGTLAKHRMVTKYKDKDHHSFEMFMTLPDGKEMPMMTIDYTRVAEKK